jgi:hypothetical protein
MANRRVVKPQALRRSDKDFLDQIAAILLSEVGFGNQLANVPVDDAANEIVISKIDGTVVSHERTS